MSLFITYVKKLCFLILLLGCTFSFSQSIKLEGLVTDSKSVGLEMANVIAINQSTKAMDAYSITNDKGKFVLNLKSNANYTLKISYLGMQNKEISISTNSQNTNQIFAMEEGGIELEGVEIVREMPVSIKGDTIVYNSDSFTNGTERKLEDILKKLPGVEVNADGEVEVEGKKVSKLMIEGKDFFDGDTKLGVKNIPADAIDKIQVLRNYSEIGALKGVENNQDNLAMNIKLKSGKKNFWFGDLTAGIGNKGERYFINPKAFYYNPKYSINLITNFNNIGELPLTVQDYYKFTGGFRGMMRKGGTSFNVSSNDLGISLLRNNRAKEIETQFGATNFSYNFNKALNVSGFAILTESITETETESQTNIFRINSSQIQSTEIRNDTGNQKSNLGLFKLSSTYKPSTQFQLDYDVLTKLSKQNEATKLLREPIVNSNSFKENITTVKNQNPISINQNLSLYYTQSDKNIFALEMQHLFQEEDPFFNAVLGRNPFPNSSDSEDPNNLNIQNQGAGRYDLNQNRFVKTNKMDAKFDYYYMVTPKNNINITVGNTYSYQSFDSNLFQILEEGTTNNLNTNSKNDVEYTFKDAFLGLHYKILTGKFTFTPGVSFHAFEMKDEQLGRLNSQNFFRALPDFLAIYQIKKAQSLTYNFSFTNNFTDINRLSEGIILSNFNNLSRGNRTLENATSIAHTLRYFKYNMYNLENISAFASYSRLIDAIKTKALFVGVNQTSTPFNSQFADETLSGNGSYGRSFLKNYKASFGVNLNWSKNNNIRIDRATRQDILVTNESFTESYTFKASTNYKNLPNLELGYNWVKNNYNNNTFYTDKPFARLEYFFLESFSFVCDYEFYHYYNSDKTIENEYDFLSSSLSYQKKKDSKLEYKISGTNLLNTNSLNDDSFSQFSTRTSQYSVQPRYIIFSMKYNL